MDDKQYQEQLDRHNEEGSIHRHPDNMERFPCDKCGTFMTNTGEEDEDEGTPAHRYIIFVCPKCGYERTYDA